MKRILAVAGSGILVALLALAVFTMSQTQRADNDWDPEVTHPTYTADHPRVVIDQAHYNAHTAGGKYRPFARLLEADGYRVVKGKQKLAPESLAGVDVLVIVNASGGPKPQIFGINIPVPTRKKREDPAFTSTEIQAVRSWVEQGGVALAVVPQADRRPKTRPVVILREMPLHRDLLVCGISTQLQQRVEDFDEMISPFAADSR